MTFQNQRQNEPILKAFHCTMLSRYEVARIVGLRSLHLSEGGIPLVTVERYDLQYDMLYIAALELRTHKLDVQIKRENGTIVNAMHVRSHPCLDILLDTKDGGTRSYSP